MQNDLNKAAGEAVSDAESSAIDPRDALSFRRPATIAEIEAGSAPFMLWNVEPTGHHQHDREVGEAMASELADFMVENDQFADRYMLSEMMRDMLRHADQEHKFVISGFGTRLAELAATGSLVYRPLADWPKAMRDAVAIQRAVDPAADKERTSDPAREFRKLMGPIYEVRAMADVLSLLSDHCIEGSTKFQGRTVFVLEEPEANSIIFAIDNIRERLEALQAAFDEVEATIPG